MPKNNKQAKNSKRRDSQEKVRRELIRKEDGQEYAQVQKALGDGRFTLYCYDNISRLGKIRGKDKRRMWITVGDIILISLRDFQDGKADVIHKYNAEESRTLQTCGDLPVTALINRTAIDMPMQDESIDEDFGFDFL